MAAKEEERGMTSCWCREAVNSLVLKLTKLMETRPVVRDLLQGLGTDELLQVWKMVLEMAYGIDDWIDPTLAASTNLVESEAEREQIREIQALIVDSRARCRRSDRLLSRVPSTSRNEHQQDDGSAAREAILDVSVGQEKMAGIASEDDMEERLDADATIKFPVSLSVRGGEDLRNVFIRFGSLPVFEKRCMMDGENKNIAAASLSSRLVFLGANLLRKEEMRARIKPKRFVQIGSMQVELPP